MWDFILTRACLQIFKETATSLSCMKWIKFGLIWMQIVEPGFKVDKPGAFLLTLQIKLGWAKSFKQERMILDL